MNAASESENKNPAQWLVAKWPNANG